MFRDTEDGQTNSYCGCMGTRTYNHGVCETCGGVEPPPTDLVAEMRCFEIDHEPEGWPAVKMRQISALCDEVERLRNQVAVAKQIVTAGVNLMHHTQLGKWVGVRSFLEQETDDYEPFKTPNLNSTTPPVA